MSMMARFVAITPNQLSSVIDKPEMVGGLFAPDAGLPTESLSELQERLRHEAAADNGDARAIAAPDTPAAAPTAWIRRERAPQPRRQ